MDNTAFDIDYILKRNSENKEAERQPLRVVSTSNQNVFYEVCEDVLTYFQELWDTKKEDETIRYQRQLDAILGKRDAVQYYMDIITDYLVKSGLTNVNYPSWYDDLVSGIFHENWGLAGVAEWKSKFPKSSSAKIIGENIFFMIDGKLVKREQTISADRFNKLKLALQLNNPDLKLSEATYELQNVDGFRIKVFTEKVAKENHASIVFRDYIVSDYTFEKQAQLRTIPSESIDFFEAFAKVGFNIAFVGAVRTAKTTLLTTFMKYEDPSLEGVFIETDPEVPMHKLLPGAPIMQLVADGEKLRNLVKDILRSDADYVVLAEARDGIQAHIAVKLASKGTRRMKMTFHLTEIFDFHSDVAEEIVMTYGGSLYMQAFKVAKTFNYVINPIQLQDKSQKRVNAIYELRYDQKYHKILYVKICEYDRLNHSWSFNYDIGERVRRIGMEENPAAFKAFESELKRLSEMYPFKCTKEDLIYEPDISYLKEVK